MRYTNILESVQFASPVTTNQRFYEVFIDMRQGLKIGLAGSPARYREPPKL